jgi:heme A synthase
MPRKREGYLTTLTGYSCVAFAWKRLLRRRWKMQKRAGGVLLVVGVFAVLGVGGLVLAESAGAVGSVTAAGALAGLISVLVVRGLLRE